MSDQMNRALDQNEAILVEQSRETTELSDRDLKELLRLLRARRDRAQAMIRTRSRAAQREGKVNVDTGARDKKALLTEAIARAEAERKRRSDPSVHAKTATQNLRDAVRHKAENPSWTGPEDLTPNSGPVETPNQKIAPSGALHAEGMRAAIARSTGDR